MTFSMLLARLVRSQVFNNNLTIKVLMCSWRLLYVGTWKHLANQFEVENYKSNYPFYMTFCLKHLSKMANPFKNLSLSFFFFLLSILRSMLGFQNKVIRKYFIAKNWTLRPWVLPWWLKAEWRCRNCSEIPKLLQASVDTRSNVYTCSGLHGG